MLLSSNYKNEKVSYSRPIIPYRLQIKPWTARFAANRSPRPFVAKLNAITVISPHARRAIKPTFLDPYMNHIARPVAKRGRLSS